MAKKSKQKKRSLFYLMKMITKESLKAIMTLKGLTTITWTWIEQDSCLIRKRFGKNVIFHSSFNHVGT